MKANIHHIAILGDGGWGTTLAIQLSKKNFSITLWGAFKKNIDILKKTRVNSKFLPGIKIPSDIKLTENLATAVQIADLIILAIPSQYLGNILKQIKTLNYQKKIFLSVIKGIDNKTLLRMSQMIIKHLGHVELAVLSGPTIAREVALGIPSTAVIAAKNLKIAKALQKILNSENFRIYTNPDIVGLELGGSLKNVIAIACGVCDGLGFGSNTKAALLTRGLVEIARLGHAMGAKTKTFAGLAGLGDLVTTCISPQSRNRYVGEQLGKGRAIKKILSSMDMVAEGVATVKAVYQLSQKHKIDMPITKEVYNIIYKDKNPLKAVNDLMRRKTKSE